MTQAEAESTAKKLWDFPVYLTRKGNGCFVLRELTETEQKFPDEEKSKIQITKTNKVVMGCGDSWIKAMRYAAKPRLEELEAEKAKRNDELRTQERDAQLRLNQFQDFLLEKFTVEFEAWLKNGQSSQPAAPIAAAGNPG